MGDIDKNKMASAREKDRLHYQTVLQSHVDKCLHSMGTMNYGTNVKSLFQAMFFNVAGLEFKDKLILFKTDLDQEMKQAMLTMALQNPGAWHHPIRHKHMMLSPTKQYNTAMFSYCMSLLAEANLLIESKDFIEMGEQNAEN